MSTSQPKPVRSPSYPNASLSEAISSVRKIEQLYRSSPVDREVGAKLIGYSGLSGPANQALAALAQYGLVERAGKGEMRVTSRAQAILHPNSDDEQREQLRAAALEPQLFRELQERFPNIIPPEDGVTTYLNRQGFNQSAIRPAAKAYLQTLLFLKESGASDSNGTEVGIPSGSAPANLTEISMEQNQAAPDATRALASLKAGFPTAFASGAEAPPLNKISMNVKGNQVHLEALLDRKGIATLKKKLLSLEALLDDDEPEAPEPIEGDD